MTEYTFTARLGILLACDIFLAVVDTFIPHELGPVRMLVATVELGFMAATMLLTARRVREDS
jgi:hypothetical protein